MKSVFGRLLHWEHWPFLLFYSPIALVWAWYCLRSRSLWFFSSSNPTLTFGGFEGEGKREMYEQLPPGSYPKTIFLSKSEPFESVLQKVNLKKPMEAHVSLIDTTKELKKAVDLCFDPF